MHDPCLPRICSGAAPTPTLKAGKLIDNAVLHATAAYQHEHGPLRITCQVSTAPRCLVRCGWRTQLCLIGTAAVRGLVSPPSPSFTWCHSRPWEEPPPPPPRGGASASGSQSTCIHSLGCCRRRCCCSRVGVPVGLCCKTAMAHLTPSELRDDEKGRRVLCWRGMGTLRRRNVSSRLSQGQREHNANATKHLWYSRTCQGQCSTIQLLRRTLKGFGTGWRLSRCAHGRRRFARTRIDQGQTSKPCGKDSSVQVTGERDIRVRALGPSCLRVPVCWGPTMLQGAPSPPSIQSLPPFQTL